MGIKIVKMNFKFEEEAIVFHLIHFDHLMCFYVQTGQMGQGRRDRLLTRQTEHLRALKHSDRMGIKIVKMKKKLFLSHSL